MRAVVLHPHPSMGGDSSHPLVVAIAQQLRAAGVDVTTPDIREPDVAAAAAQLSALDVRWLVGYSWGSVVASHATPADLAARVLIAPPASMPLGGDTSTPTLAILPERDQFGGPDSFVAGPNVTREVVPGEDHFLWGAIDVVAARCVAWLLAEA